MIRSFQKLSQHIVAKSRSVSFFKKVVQIGLVSTASYTGYHIFKTNLESLNLNLKHALVQPVNAATAKGIKSPMYALADVVENVCPAVVSVCIKYSIWTSLGSGFIIQPDGYVLTAAHVVGRESQVYVTLVDGREYLASVLAVDSDSDLALLKIREAKDKALPYLKFADIVQSRPGEFVLAMGSPVGLSNTVTMGVISNVERDIGRKIGLKYVQTDAAITKGNSGGPLVNVEGEVVGINVMTMAPGFSFAIPVDHAERFINAAMKKLDKNPVTNYKPGTYIGFSMVTLTQEMLKYMHLRNMYDSVQNGVFIKQVDGDSPAERAGFRSGDIILQIDGNPIANTDDVYKQIQNKSQMTFTVFRNGQIMKIGPVKPMK